MNPLFDQIKNSKFLISGPCVIENEDMVMRLAEQIAEIAAKFDLTYFFKASYDKANRTSISSYRGPGLDEGLRILQKVKEQFGLPVCTDIHEAAQAAPVGEVADIVQIPAFLCRQTDLLVAAAKTGQIVNIKKGQFLSGKDMKHPVQKVLDSGNHQVLLTERGNMMGYGDLVVDMRNLVDMKALGVPVVMDVTHSTQKPGGLDGKSGGNREYAPYLAAAAAAVGVDGFFFEVHENPEKALSDGPNMVKLTEFEGVLENIFDRK
ncbi:MAG: 3-deoxy-8-phosphooctulonate synthase [Cytophagales bacterium]|nr:3-deoxy-8-phosphooctulonate synthase [Cytophagales bacterium]